MAKKNGNMMSAIKTTAITTGGAVVGTKVSDYIEKTIAEKRPTKANKLAPLITTGLGVLGQIFVKNENAKEFFLGMTIVSTAEVLEKMMPSEAPVYNQTTGQLIEGRRLGASQKLNGNRVTASQKLNGYRKY